MTPKQKEVSARKLIKEGKSDLFISGKLGMCRNKLSRMRRFMGIAPRPHGTPRLPAAKRERIEALIRCGESILFIARVTRSTPFTVKYIRDKITTDEQLRQMELSRRGED